MIKKNQLLTLLLLNTSLFSGCIKNENKETAQTAPVSCELQAGKYEVQSVTHHSGKGEYQFFLINAPACAIMPVKFEQVKLARLNSEDKKPVARLDIVSGEDPSLFMTENFKIDLIQTVVQEDKSVREESSSWMPFVAGAAGAVVGSMLMSSLMRPQYYMPPPAQPGSAHVRGYGAQGDSYKNAANSYQSKYNTPPPHEAHRGYYQKQAAQMQKRKLFDSKASRERSVERKRASTPPRRGFLRMRRR